MSLPFLIPTQQLFSGLRGRVEKKGIDSVRSNYAFEILRRQYPIAPNPKRFREATKFSISLASSAGLGRPSGTHYIEHASSGKLVHDTPSLLDRKTAAQSVWTDERVLSIFSAPSWRRPNALWLAFCL